MNASYTDATDFINVEDVDKVVVTTPNSVTSSVLGLAFYSEKRRERIFNWIRRDHNVYS